MDEGDKGDFRIWVWPPVGWDFGLLARGDGVSFDRLRMSGVRTVVVVSPTAGGLRKVVFCPVFSVSCVADRPRERWGGATARGAVADAGV